MYFGNIVEKILVTLWIKLCFNPIHRSLEYWSSKKAKCEKRIVFKWQYFCPPKRFLLGVLTLGVERIYGPCLSTLSKTHKICVHLLSAEESSPTSCWWGLADFKCPKYVHNGFKKNCLDISLTAKPFSQHLCSFLWFLGDLFVPYCLHWSFCELKYLYILTLNKGSWNTVRNYYLK